MPTLTRQQQRLATRQLVSGRDSTDSAEDMADQFWIVDDDYERPQKEMDFPAAPLSKAPSRHESMNNLRIHTDHKTTLHERYLSSEEEPSPSPDSETASTIGDDEQDHQQEEEIKQKSPEKFIEDTVEPLDYTTVVAVAVPIMAIGRPKLVDITNLAPMHKRKRSLENAPLSRTAMKNAAAARIPATTDENVAPLKRSTLSTKSSEDQLLRHHDSSSSLNEAPESWLPDDSDDVSTATEDAESEHYFPELDIRKPLTYNDYDPYLLNPPKLSPRSSYNARSPSTSSAPRKPGSIARARKQAYAASPVLRRSNSRISSNGPTGQGNWKGLARTLSMAKKQEAMHPREVKKPKMLARGPTEREEMPTIPPFPFEAGKMPL